VIMNKIIAPFLYESKRVFGVSPLSQTVKSLQLLIPSKSFSTSRNLVIYY